MGHSLAPESCATLTPLRNVQHNAAVILGLNVMSLLSVTRLCNTISLDSLTTFPRIAVLFKQYSGAAISSKIRKRVRNVQLPGSLFSTFLNIFG